jgi:dipeptidase
VPHTYRHFANTYGIMNEHQVGMAESTCSAVFGAKAVGNGGDALLSIDALSRIGLERCASSRCAVQTMGRLAEEFGFYGPGSFEGSAESLMVIDATEAFVFHILPDDTGKSAIWAAARVPDDGAAVVANMFVIREVNLTDSHNFLGSSNMHRIASDVLHAWSNSTGELLDFTRVFSDGEYAHKYYSGRRMWGAMRLLAPSANFPDQYDDLKFKAAYPFAVTPDKKIAREDLFQIHRSYVGMTLPLPLLALVG